MGAQWEQPAFRSQRPIAIDASIGYPLPIMGSSSDGFGQRSMQSMNTRLLAFLLSTGLVAGLAGTAVSETSVELHFLKGERWWAGVTSQSHRMPLTAESTFAADLMGDTHGNQAQPLLLSDQGRFVWCDDPFAFEFARGVLKAQSTLGSLILGTNGTTLRSVYRHVSETYFPAAGRTPHPTLFTHPQYNTWIELTYNQNQRDVLKYARGIVENGFPAGVLMIDEGWFRTYGDWDFNLARFPDPSGMMNELHGLGFKVMLWVCPYISPDGAHFKTLWLNHTRRGETVWIENAENTSQPALMEWWNGYSAVADLSNPAGMSWFRTQLDHLMTTYGVDGFKFDGGDARYYLSTMIMPPKSFQPDITPNGHCEAFARLGLEYPLNEYRACWKMGGQPLAQRLRDKRHSWDDLRKLVPGAINQGLMGYAFTCPDMIGGGEYLSFMDLGKVDQELIVRAAQCHALMPMMQFSVAPWRVLNETNLEICRQMAVLHEEMGREILGLAKEAARTGEPIVRSLEYQFPGRGYVDVVDQFLLGDAILVAPVLKKGARTRTVIFPEGRWRGDDGSLVVGPSQMEIEVPLRRLPWYRKL